MIRIIFIASALMLCLVSNAQVKLGFNGEYAATVGIYVKDIKTGEVIASNDAYRAMSPASVMKTVTAASALSSLPADFVFETKVYLSGAVSNGICNGNIVIASCGDPTIDSENFDDRPTLCSEIYSALAEKGIKKINGKIIVEQSLSDAGCIPQWEIDDVAWSYGAGLYGFNYRDNVFKLWPATKKTEPTVPGLNVTVRVGKSTDLIRGIDSNNLTVYGAKPNDRAWRVSSTMDSPADVFASELKAYLKTNGIDVAGKSIDKAHNTLLYTHKSPSLSDILAETLIYSHNLFAEGMLRALCPGASRKAAIDQEVKLWSDRGIKTAYNKILDGSGLSRADRVQPIFIANILEWMATSEYAGTYVSLFPKVGIDGTVKGFLKDTPLTGKLALKTGSMNAVQCYAGYKLDDDDKPTHVVVIFINAFYCDRSALRASIEKFLTETFKQN